VIDERFERAAVPEILAEPDLDRARRADGLAEGTAALAAEAAWTTSSR
jgi:hypothetical protein